MINLAVIGVGYWGPNHIRAFNNPPKSAVVAVSDLDAARLERIKATYPAMRLEQDYQRILADPEVTAVVIATPTNTHYQITREAILAGKHVLCEKPLCDDGDCGVELVKLAQERGCLIVVGHVFLFNPGIIKLKELIDGGEFGKVQYLAAVRTNLGPIRSDVNAAYDLATHDISIFNWLLGEIPESVSAIGGAFLRPTIEDVVFISLKYPGGALANIHASWLNPKKVRQITIVGNQRMATWDDMQPGMPVAIYEKGVKCTQEYNSYGEFLRLSMWDGEIRMPKVGPEEPLKMQADEFIRYIEAGHVERSDARFGVGVVKTLHAIASSVRQGGSPAVVVQ